MQDNEIIEECIKLQSNEVTEEVVQCQNNEVAEYVPRLQGNSVAEENQTLQGNEIVTETVSTAAAEYAEEGETPATEFAEASAPVAADYSEESPTLQDNAVEQESGTVTPVTPGEEPAPEEVSPRTDIAGSVAVSKDATVGGKVRVGDDALFKRNVTIEGWLDAKNIRGNLKEILDYAALSVKVMTDKGNVLHNGEGKLELTAYVYYRGEDITERIYEGRFSWKRVSKDTTGDRIWNRLHDGIGRKCTVTDEDVDYNAIFTCEVNIDETSLYTENKNE